MGKAASRLVRRISKIGEWLDVSILAFDCCRCSQFVGWWSWKSAVLVTEAQCKATLNWLNPSWHTIACMSAEGKTFTKQEAKIAKSGADIIRRRSPSPRQPRFSANSFD
jgi:hypothetical protein